LRDLIAQAPIRRQTGKVKTGVPSLPTIEIKANVLARLQRTLSLEDLALRA